MKLKKYLLATALVGLGSAPTLAADLAARPYTKAPALAAVYDWTGFYIGVNAGVGIGRDRIQHDWIGTGTPYSFYMSPQGGFGGGQIGYNWQTGSVLGPIVFGVEADIQGAGLSDDRTNFSNARHQHGLSSEARLVRHGRGRVGIANGPVLSYVTAGYAFGNVKTNATQSALGFTTRFSTDRTQSGWVVGSGVEAALGGNWTGKIEYLYLNLGNKTDLSDALPCEPDQHRDPREHLPRRPELPDRRHGLCAGRRRELDRFLSRRQFRLRHRPGSQLDEHTGGTLVETFNLAPDGINGGVQAGYNWQAANWVFGLEADIQGCTQQDNKTCVIFCAPGVFAAYDATLPWFGTVRGRLGYSVGSTLFYATGGLRLRQHQDQDRHRRFRRPGDAILLAHQAGWTAGAGIETPFTLLGLLGPNWTTKTEYLYVDLGSTTDSCIFGGVPATSTRSVTEHIFRTGMNYHFNSPVVAKY